MTTPDDLPPPLDLSNDEDMSDLAPDMTPDMEPDMGPDMDMQPDQDIDMTHDMSTPLDMEPDQDRDMAPDMSLDMPLDMELDLGEDMAPDMVDMAPDLAIDLCDGVDCGPHGRCEAGASAPRCDCDPGYIAQGLTCVPLNRPPTWSNLPATTRAPVGRAGGFMAAATDPDADPLTFSVNAAACPFPASVDPSGLVTWTCPATSASCLLVLTAADPAGLSAASALLIECENTPPIFTSTPPAQAEELTTLRYAISCLDPDGPVALGVAPGDTCGGALVGAEYVFTPTEAQGGTTCALALTCADPERVVTQLIQLAVLERNQPPALLNLPASITRHGASTFAPTASDADLPAQALTFTLDSTSCSPAPTIQAQTGELSIACGPQATCAAQISVSDGEDTAAATLSITCANAPPTVSAVAITPAQPARPGDPLTCAYTFFDADGDPDSSRITWLIGGQPVAQGPSFSAYSAGDVITCRVTPRDGYADGAAVDAAPLTAPTPQLTLTAGAAHSCARSGDALYCWGDNTYGQLGQPAASALHQPAPRLIFARDVTAVSAHELHSCAVHDGALKCWGLNIAGQLGTALNLNSEAPNPTPHTVFAAGVGAMEVGANHSCAVHQGQLKCWGYNTHGQLGVITAQSAVSAPQTTALGPVSALSLGGLHSCAIDAGALKCWGSNRYGQLGAPTNAGAETPTPSPQTVFASDVTDVAAGWWHTCAVRAGELWCWGNNVSGELGAPPSAGGSAPRQVAASGVARVAVGDLHTCALRTSGALECWGDNSFGQLGVTTMTPQVHTPQTVFASGVTDVAVGWQHTCAVHQGVTKCWGMNATAQLGVAGLRSPAPVLTSPLAGLLRLIAGAAQTCALSQSGALECWGAQLLGAQPAGWPREPRPLPQQLFGSGVLDASSGWGGHACAVRQGGALECWGANHHGQLGVATALGQTTPDPQLVRASGIARVYAGMRHTCAVRTSGALECWGNNLYGQLGGPTNLGTNTAVLAPQTVFAAGVTEVALGESHTCALHQGQLKCWGHNTDGQLGVDAVGASTAMPQTVGLANVSAITAGLRHTCALHDAGLSCWGDNALGQLGAAGGFVSGGANPDPQLVLASGVTQAQAGQHTTCAVHQGALKCWGLNDSGQLGAGVALDEADPTHRTLLPDQVSALAVGARHVCAVRAGLQVCFGANEHGALGAGGARTARPQPVILP